KLSLVRQTTTPTPNPSPQGGGEQTECVVTLSAPISPERALVCGFGFVFTRRPPPSSPSLGSFSQPLALGGWSAGLASFSRATTSGLHPFGWVRFHTSRLGPLGMFTMSNSPAHLRSATLRPAFACRPGGADKSKAICNTAGCRSQEKNPNRSCTN